MHKRGILQQLMHGLCSSSTVAEHCGRTSNPGLSLMLMGLSTTHLPPADQHGLFAVDAHGVVHGVAEQAHRTAAVQEHRIAAVGQTAVVEHRIAAEVPRTDRLGILEVDQLQRGSPWDPALHACSYPLPAVPAVHTELHHRKERHRAAVRCMGLACWDD